METKFIRQLVVVKAD